MHIRCPHCGAEGKLDEAKIPPGGGVLTCPKCRQRFPVGKSEQSEPRLDAGQPTAPISSATAAHDGEFAFIRRLDEESGKWEQEGLLTPDQRMRILARYRLAREVEEKAGPGRLITTISVLGSILVGVGVLLFIASNWSAIPRWGKLGIIFGTMLAGYATGYWLRFERQSYPKVGGALILLGSLVFGAGIFFIAQIYHISVHYPNGPLMWGLAILPLAYLLRFRSLQILALLDLLIWSGMEMRFWISEGYGYGERHMVVFYLLAGLTYWMLGLAHGSGGRWRELAAPYVTMGGLLAFGAGFILTFDVYEHALGTPNLSRFYFGMTLIFLLALVFHLKGRISETRWQGELLALLAAMGCAIWLALGFTGLKHGTSLMPATLAANILYAAALLGVIWLGYIRRRPLYINLGLFFFVLDLIARYFDFFFRLLPRSLFFIGGGLLLMAGAVFLERKRRRVLESFRYGEVAR